MPPLEQAAQDPAAQAAEEDVRPEDVWNELDAADAAMAAASDAGKEPAPAGAIQDADSEWGEGAQHPENGAGSPEAPETDIWEGASPEQRAAYEALERKFKSVHGRANAFQRRYEDLRAAAEPRIRLNDRKSPKAAIAAIKDDYPEIAEPLIEALEPIEERLNEQTAAETRRLEAAQHELNEFVGQQEALLAERHPDWLETLGGHKDEFAAWIEDQPRRIRDAAKRNGDTIADAEEAAEIVALFKEHLTGEPQIAAAQDIQTNRNPLDDRRARQLGASQFPSGRGPARPLVSGIPREGDPQQIWNAFEEMDRRKAARPY